MARIPRRKQDAYTDRSDKSARLHRGTKSFGASKTASTRHRKTALDKRAVRSTSPSSISEASLLDIEHGDAEKSDIVDRCIRPSVANDAARNCSSRSEDRASTILTSPDSSPTLREIYHAYALLPTIEPAYQDDSPSSSDSDPMLKPQDQPTWVVHSIVDSARGSRGKLFYRVKWEDTWEPAESLQGCADTAIKDFHTMNPGSPNLHSKKHD